MTPIHLAIGGCASLGLGYLLRHISTPTAGMSNASMTLAQRSNHNAQNSSNAHASMDLFGSGFLAFTGMVTGAAAIALMMLGSAFVGLGTGLITTSALIALKVSRPYQLGAVIGIVFGMFNFFHRRAL